MDRAAIAAVAALDDDVRRALFEHVAAAAAPVTREEAASAVGISRKLAAFHLDKLVSLGLLRSGFATGARRVGRTPRVYEPAPAELAVQVPERAPDVLADILVTALSDDASDGRAAALRVARSRGREVGASAAVGGRRPVGLERAMGLAHRVLERQGFHPYRSPSGIRLRNCVFHRFAAAAPELVCGLNCAYIGGMIEGLEVDGRVAAALAPRPGECCVEVRPRAGS